MNVRRTVVLATLLVSTPCLAATLTVTEATDVYDGICDDACSLRDAIEAANREAGADVIVIPSGTYVLSLAVAAIDEAGAGDLDIHDDTTIEGAGSRRTIVDGGGIDRAFEVHPGAALRLSRLTVRNGNADGGGGVRVHPTASLTADHCELVENTSREHGGAIHNDGTATLRDCTLRSNAALAFGDGGGVYNGSPAVLTVERCVFDMNSARNGVGIHNEGVLQISDSVLSNGSAHGIGVGGGVFNRGQASLRRCTLNDNSAFGGGGVFNRAGAFLTMENCTLSANVVEGFGRGGGLYSRGTAALVNCTLYANAAFSGAGIFSGGMTRLVNTIITGGRLGASCLGSIVSGGHNLDDDGACGLAAPGDISRGAAHLAPLGDHGGFTRTHALCEAPAFPDPACDAASSAIDAGDDAQCPRTDQRGASRFAGLACDMGAFESGARVPGSCRGDCGGDGVVTVDDLIRIIEIALGGAPLTECVRVDGDDDMVVTVDEILVAVTAAVRGCESS